MRWYGHPVGTPCTRSWDCQESDDGRKSALTELRGELKNNWRAGSVGQRSTTIHVYKFGVLKLAFNQTTTPLLPEMTWNYPLLTVSD